MLKKMNEKKNNKGFSLVELIVVILIMAVLAVAIAPQVMRWVNESRKSSDINNYDSLVSICQLALTDEDAYSALTSSHGYNLVVGTSNTTLYTGETGTTATANTDNFYKALDKLDPNWTKVKVQASGITSYQITVTSAGAVSSTNPPAR